jgi:hypothetical protein
MLKGETAEEGGGVDLHALGEVAESYPRLGIFGSRGCLCTWMGMRKPL